MCHLLADVVDVRDVFREIRDAAGPFGNIFQRALGFLRALLAFLAEQANRVNDRIGLLNFADGFFQRVVAGIVLAVGDNQEHVLVFRGFLQMIE